MIKIGEYELYSIETSEFGLDGGAMFGIIPKPLWVKKVKTDKYNRIEMVTRSLLLSGDGKNILIKAFWQDSKSISAYYYYKTCNIS